MKFSMVIFCKSRLHLFSLYVVFLIVRQHEQNTFYQGMLLFIHFSRLQIQSCRPAAAIRIFQCMVGL